MSNPRASLADLVLRFSLYAFAIGSFQGIAITQSALILGLVVWGVDARLRRRSPTMVADGEVTGWRLTTPVDLAFLLWLGSGIVSTVFAVDPLASLDKLRKIFMIGTVYLFAFRLGTWARTERVVFALLLSASVASIVGVVDYLGHPYGLDGRTRGTMGHYMTMGGLLMLAASVSVALALFGRTGGWRRPFLWFSAAATTLCLVLTFTRSAWVGFLVAVVTLLGLKKRWLVVPLAAALVVLYLGASPGFQDRMSSIVDPGHRANVERVHMWRAGLEIFRDHPLVGVGLMDMAEVYDEYRPPDARERHGHFHNVFVQVAAARGAVGLVAFLYLLWAMGNAIWRGLRAARSISPTAHALGAGAYGAYLGFVVSGLFEWNFGDSEVIMVVYFLVGVGIALERISGNAR